MLQNKDKYKIILSTNYLPVFFQDWFLDAVCPGQWDVVVYEDQGTILGVYVYMLKQKFGINYIVPPQLCPYTGPYFFTSENNDKIYKSLIKQLPAHQLLIQDYFPSVKIGTSTENLTNGKHTNIIKPVGIDTFKAGLKSSLRTDLKKAKNEMTINPISDFKEFYEFLEMSWLEKNQKNPYNSILFGKIDEELDDRKQRRIIKCSNIEGQTVAMAYFIYDEHWTYNFVNCISRITSHNGMALILYNEIIQSISQCRSFDFEGSMIVGVDKFFKKFGGERINYHSIYRSKNFLIDLAVNFKTGNLSLR